MMTFPISMSPKKISIKTSNNFQNFPIIGQLMTCSVVPIIYFKILLTVVQHNSLGLL